MSNLARLQATITAFTQGTGYFLRIFFILAAILLSSGCKDQGCIEADDFGEYEYQTVEVFANNLSGSCELGSSDDPSDVSHGSGLKQCLTSEVLQLEYVDDQGEVQSKKTEAGCIKETDRIAKNSCMQLCVAKCISNQSKGDAGAAKPNWKSTSQKDPNMNFGVTIPPATEIEVIAKGSIQLGDEATYPAYFINPRNKIPHSVNNNNNALTFDVSNGQSIELYFSGSWSGGSTTYGSNSLDSQSYNMAKRTILYLIPHKEGYSLDASGNEVGTPLWPNKDKWACSRDDEQNINCSSGSDSYPISTTNNTSISPGLGSYGGLIRWSQDNLISNNTNYFGSIVCRDVGDCDDMQPIIDASNEKGYSVGFLVGDIGSEASYQNRTGFPIKIAFKALKTGACNNATINFGIYDGYGSDATQIQSSINASVTISDNQWHDQMANSHKHITLEPNHVLKYSTSNTFGSNINCGHVVAAKISRYHDIQVSQSGFISFKNVIAGFPTTNIKARVINPSGQHNPKSTGYSPDFYEYGDFNNSSSGDPFSTISVTSAAWKADGAQGYDLFVRKGQVIRFSPESWDVESGSHDGFGVAIHIEPRPALLCTEVESSAYVNNSDCQITEFNAQNEIIGCAAQHLDCINESSSSYCPSSDHQKAVTCATDGVEPLYQKTNCSQASSARSNNFGNGQGGNLGFDQVSCNSCSSLIFDQAQKPAKTLVQGIKQCFDLERYTGNVANLQAANYDLNSENIEPGATILGNFNGEYGNLDGFLIDEDEAGNIRKSSTGKTIFKVGRPAAFSEEGRLRFLAIDNTDLRQITNAQNNNSSIESGYNGNNGVELGFGGPLKFSNGKYLDVVLCKEGVDSNGNSTGDCSRSQISALDSLVTYDLSKLNGEVIAGSKYYFGSNGTLIRRTAQDITRDCLDDPHKVATVLGVKYYCHINEFNNPDEKDKWQQIQRYRLSFLISDPELSDCEINNPANNRITPSLGQQGRWDGLLQRNVNYNSAESSNSNGVCGKDEQNCGKQYLCLSKYSNNSGSYSVTVKSKVTNSGSNISSLIDGVISPVIEAIDGRAAQDGQDAQTGQVERIYKAIITDGRYKAIVTTLMTLMVTFYGIGYLMGVSNFTNAEIVGRVFKIGIIYFFIGETGWEQFNQYIVQFFKAGSDQLAYMMASSFDDSPEIAAAIENNNYTDKAILFSSVDRVFTLIFSSVIYKKVSALLFAGIFGWAYMLIVLYSFLLYIYAVAHAVLLYLTAQVFISILFVLAPIFFLFLLFDQTKEMFDNWLKTLISFMLQQIFLLTTLAFFNILMYEVIKLTLGYKICFETVWRMNILIDIPILDAWNIASMGTRYTSQRDVGDVGNATDIPSLFHILFIWIIASLMQNFVKFMTDLASSIVAVGGISTTNLAKGAAEAAQRVKGMVKSGAQEAYVRSGMQNQVQRIDQKLFDSGRLADNARHQKKQENKLDRTNRSAMSKAGDKALKDLQKKDPAAFAKMSEEQIKQKIDEAMTKKGKKMGLDDKQIDKLKSDRGIKYEGDNVLGATAAAIYQKSTGAGTGNLNDKKIDKRLSRSDARAAIRGAKSEEERNKIISDIEKGDVSLKNETMRKAIRNAVNSPVEAMKARLNKARKENRFVGEDFDKAARQLEDEGTINRRVKGFRAAGRGKAEHEAIVERMKENQKQAAVSPKQEAPEASAVQELKDYNKKVGEDIKIDESDLNEVRKIGKKIQNNAKFAKDQIAKQTKQSPEKDQEVLNDNIKEKNFQQLRGQLKDNKAQSAKLERAKDQVEQEIDDLRDSPGDTAEQKQENDTNLKQAYRKLRQIEAKQKAVEEQQKGLYEMVAEESEDYLAYDKQETRKENFQKLDSIRKNKKDLETENTNLEKEAQEEGEEDSSNSEREYKIRKNQAKINDNKKKIDQLKEQEKDFISQNQIDEEGYENYRKLSEEDSDNQ